MKPPINQVLFLLVLMLVPLQAQQQPMPFLNRIELSATEVIGPAQLQGRVFLAAPAPTGGATIGLWSGTQVTIPRTVFVPQGANQVGFPIEVLATTSPIDVVIGATSAGRVEVQLRVLPPPRLTALKFARDYGAAGKEVRGTVEVEKAAPRSMGLEVKLSNGTTVQIPPGQASGTFSLVTPPSDEDTTFRLQARLGSSEVSGQLPLFATPRVTAVEVGKEVVAEEPAQATVRLARPAPKGGVELDVRRNLNLKMPSAVAVEAGATSAQLTFTGQPVRMPTLVELEVGGKKTSFYLTPSPTVAVREGFNFWLSANDKQPVLDDPAAPGQKWKLTFEGGPRIEKAAPGQYLVQADFSGTLGTDPTVHRVILELTYEGAAQAWKLVKTRIHSVNGNPRPR